MESIDVMASCAYSHHDVPSKSHHITLVHFPSIPTQFPLTPYLHTVSMILMDCSIGSDNLNAGCLILIVNSSRDYGDDFLCFILVQALGNLFNFPLYTVNSLHSLDFPL
jgi:hypothetical protein